VAGDVREVEVFVTGGITDGTLGPVTIGCSLLGGSGDFSGSMSRAGAPSAPVKIGKDAIAGSGGQSAFIRSLGGDITTASTSAAR